MSTRSNEGGFSLLELAIALFILAVGLLAMAKMQISSIQGNAFGGRMTTAVALAQAQMEDLMNQQLEGTGGPFDPATNPWPQPGQTKKVPADGPAVVQDPTIMGTQYRGYTVNWRITANSPIDNVATINVWVSWPGGKRPINLTAIKRR
jgi:type IV pilus assembly protein PilV